MQEILLTLIFEGFLRAFLFGCPNLEFIVVAYIISGVLEQPKETYQSNHSKNKSKEQMRRTFSYPTKIKTSLTSFG